MHSVILFTFIICAYSSDLIVPEVPTGGELDVVYSDGQEFKAFKTADDVYTDSADGSKYNALRVDILLSQAKSVTVCGED